MKKYIKLAILLLSIAIAVLAYYTPLPVWLSNSLIALIIANTAYKDISKVLEDNTPLKNNKALENKHKNMELENFLIEAVKERFKIQASIDAIENKIKYIAERETFKKYNSEILINDGMEFELLGVKANFDTYETDIELEEVNISLAFFCKSKLPKNKKEHLEKVKEKYRINKHLEYNNYKIPIWKELDYSVKVEDVLSDNINLLIE